MIIKKIFDNNFKILRYVFLLLPFLLFFSHKFENLFIALGGIVLVLIFSVCPRCKCNIIFYSILNKFPVFRSIIFGKPSLVCPLCNFPHHEQNVDQSCKHRETVAYVSWLDFLSFCILAGIAFVCLICMLPAIMPHIVFLAISWGVLGIVFSRIWQLIKFKYSRKDVINLLKLFFVFLALNLTFLPDTIKYQNLLNELHNLNSDNINEIKAVGDVNVTVSSKDKIEKFVKIAKNAEAYTTKRLLTKKNFDFYIKGKANNYTFRARILEKQSDDIIIDFKAFIFYNKIKIPHGAEWLKSSASRTP